MPIYMDRHNVEGISPEQFEEAHALDMALQDQYQIRFLSIWFDEQQGLSFCLAEAPNGEAVRHIHQATHGNVPSDVIKVDLEEVKAFLGRTEDPEHEEGAPPLAGIDSAFRVILFTDQYESTAAALRYGDRKAFEMLRVHDTMAEEAVEAYNGRIVKHTGDGFMCSFSSVVDALRSAVEFQRKLAAYNKENPDFPIRVRMGLNAGNPVEHAGDLFGITVQMAARVCNHAQPDQILVTGIIRELCEDPSWISNYEDAGRVALKGMPSAVQLYNITWSTAPIITTRKETGTMQVIGAGIGRTGTSSLKRALEQLGFDKCYHMDELARNPAHVPQWLDAADGKKVNWDALFAGYKSAVDLPTYAFYQELMAQYPDAKIILTTRDPEAWYESAAQTIFRLPSPMMMTLLRWGSFLSSRLKTLTKIEPVARKVGIEKFFHNDLSKENAIKVFNEHNEQVKQTVPADRLLVYQVEQGWEPLCDFLKVPVPNLPFPHKNTREEFAS